MEKRGQRKTREGVVVSADMNKTIVIEMKRRLRHPIYGKYVTRRKKFYVHDENNECRVGDTVRIMETRPLSKLKRWRLVSVLERAK
ncbi:MAG: 30S ribosomal protein S17 [Candidatus Eisenbacteria bacterium]|nr:30S ribosomal protein S17 [Candidatus Eisenbacteria bacterium]